MKRQRARSVLLQFDPARDVLASGKRLSGGMSAAIAIGDTLWLVHDETVSVERLRAERTRGGALRYADHRQFDLRSFVSMPDSEGGDAEEADLEGLAYADGFLWVVGSHSAMREKAEGGSASDAVAALANVRRSANRCLLARIPVTSGGSGPTLAHRLRTSNGDVVTASRLRSERRKDDLTRMLRDDPHLGPYLTLPSKDNGFDIEGLAAGPGGRLFLGLRGPVLDGWACVLEVQVATDPARPHELMLQPIERHSAGPKKAARYHKHFLDLGGDGIRDLCVAGRDLLLLTGPPMRGKGTARVRRWPNAWAGRNERMIDIGQLPTLLEMPYHAKKNHPEGIAILARDGRRALTMVIYDSADEQLRLPPAGMRATVYELDLR